MNIFVLFIEFENKNLSLERENLDKEKWTSLQTSLKCLY